MDQEACRRIHEATLEVLSETGVRFEHPEVFRLLVEAGARPGNRGDELRLPAQMVEEHLRLAPNSVRLDRRKGAGVELTARSPSIFWTNPGLQILDRSGLRPVESRDLCTVARLADRLDNVHGVMGMAMADIPPLCRDFVGVRVLAENCRRHVRALCFSGQGMEALLAMKQVLPGSWLSIGFTAHGPLRWTHLALDVFLRSAGQGIPATINGEPMAGVTGPVTLAGSVVVGNAEILAGIVANQVIEPGRPVIYNLGLAHTFDMKYACAVTGGPENALFAEASAALGRFYDLPSSSWVSTESLFDDSQAALEKMFGFHAHLASGVSLIWGMGQLESEKTLSLVQLVLDDEMINYTKRYRAGFEVDKHSMALDEIRTVGICGSFLETDHTLVHFRKELWEPVILNRQARKPGLQALEEAAASRVDALLGIADRDEPVLADDEATELRKIELMFRTRICA